MRRATSKAKMAVVALPALALFGVIDACKTPTQVTLDLRSTNDCSVLRGVDLGVADEPVVAEERVGSFLTASAPQCRPGSLEIGTLVVTPGERGTASVIVVAGVSSASKDCKRPDYKGCVVARRRFTFVESRALVVPILIDFACEDVPCDVQSTCKNGQCIDSALECNDESCEPVDPRARDDGGLVDGAPDVLADGPNDGSSVDGANDGSAKDGSAPSDANIDVVVPPDCPHACPTAGMDMTCEVDNACCYRLNAAPTCLPPNACIQVGGSVPPGVAACCGGSPDCGGLGTFCCVNFTNKSPFIGVATCFSKPCVEGDQAQLCESDVDCNGSACVACTTLGLNHPSLKCCTQE